MPFLSYRDSWEFASGTAWRDGQPNAYWSNHASDPDDVKAGVDSRFSITYRLYHQQVMNTDRLDATFAALADPTRRALLARLAKGEASVMELAEPFHMSQPAISKHLKVLERAGLVSRGRDAQRRPCRLEAVPLREATDWLERYREHWERRFQQLADLLEELKTKEKRHGRKR